LRDLDNINSTPMILNDPCVMTHADLFLIY